MKIINICLIGFGNASKAFCKMLLEKNTDLQTIVGYEVKITAIATRSKGSLLNLNGIDLQAALECVSKNETLSGYSEDAVDLDTKALIKVSKADVLIELSALSIQDGQPAMSYIETAFDLKMHVITGNKGPIAWDFHRLKNIATENGLEFLYETTVMDGAPIFNMVKYTLPGCKVVSFKGILNSTTNFIIEEMEKGNTYESAVKEAQLRGFAEADPSLDVDGWDAAAKTAALANVLMDASLTPVEIARQGVGQMTIEEIEDARKVGKKIKLLCEGFVENGVVRGRVTPTLIPMTDLFATIDATSSVLAITTDLMGEVIMVEKNPEIEQTAYGIYSDLLTLLKSV